MVLLPEPIRLRGCSSSLCGHCPTSGYGSPRKSAGTSWLTGFQVSPPSSERNMPADGDADVHPLRIERIELDRMAATCLPRPATSARATGARGGRGSAPSCPRRRLTGRARRGHPRDTACRALRAVRARCATSRSASAPMPRAGRPSSTAATSDHGRSSAVRSGRRPNGWPPRTACRHAGRPSRDRSPSRRAADPRPPSGGDHHRPREGRALCACRPVRGR